MSKALYLECASGISGDMTVAALLDLGANKQILKEVLQSLPLKGYRVVISRVQKSAVQCTDFNVVLDEDNHDHDMDYLYRRDHHEEDHHHHHGRHLSEINRIIDQGEMSENARRIAKEIFLILGKSESKAHGVPLDEVHFHEVGAVDSIVDIVSIAVCVDDLGVDDVIVTKVNEGQGMVRCQHGLLPVPVPAVSNIASEYDIPFGQLGMDGEFVTPTGIATVAALRTRTTLPSVYTIEKVGFGAGKREYDGPGYLRAMIIKENSSGSGSVIKLETNVDDCSGEALGYTMERLYEAGANDVHYIPVQMKKNRPGYLLTVICEERDVEVMKQIIFHETTTLGIRSIKMDTTSLPRRIIDVDTDYGMVKVKEAKTDEGVRYSPEYESMKELCRKHHISIQRMEEIIREEIIRQRRKG